MVLDSIVELNVNFTRTFGYLLLFLITFLECSAIIGIFIPGALVVFFAGFLGKLAFLSTWKIISIAIIGGVLGNLAGYGIGKFLGRDFILNKTKYLLIEEGHVKKYFKVVCNHFGKLIIFGKLNHLNHSVLPLIAGAHKINFSRFMFFNVLSVSLWTSILVAAGYIYGNYYRLADEYAQDYLMWSLIAIFSIYALYLIYKFVKAFIKNRGIFWQ